MPSLVPLLCVINMLNKDLNPVLNTYLLLDSVMSSLGLCASLFHCRSWLGRVLYINSQKTSKHSASVLFSGAFSPDSSSGQISKSLDGWMSVRRKVHSQSGCIFMQIALGNTHLKLNPMNERGWTGSARLRRKGMGDVGHPPART